MAGAQEVTLLPGEVEASEVTLAGVRHGELLPKTKCDTIGVFAHLGDESRLAVGLPVYRRVELLGRGAFGKAYLVEAMTGLTGHPESKPQRVLKKMPLQGVNADQREAAFREALVMRKICRGCPFITQFSEVFLGKGGAMLCLVMEYCAGGDLRNLLRNREGARLPEEEVLSLAAQVGLALHHCHAHGVLHRDVKPENCFLRAQGGDVLLGDFGISCTLDERSMAKSCVGSPLYLSPEVVNQERYSWKTDVWSWGVMLYEMLMLAPPFKGTNICQVAFQILCATPEPVDSYYSEATRGLVGRLLDKNASTRAQLDQVMTAGPLTSAAQAAAARHSLPWPPPPVATKQKQSYFMRKLREHTGRGGAAHREASPCVEYESDFEAMDEEEETESEREAEYEDDFEAVSSCSEVSYASDFEDESDPGEFSEEFDAKLEELTEEKVRRQLLAELGAEGLTIAESLGLVSFFEGLQISARGKAVH